MTSPSSTVVLSTEMECLTSITNSKQPAEHAIVRFFEIMNELAPTLPATSGIFNGYGRLYIDCSHVEIAACECSSPYDLPGIVERQQTLIQKTVDRLREEGFALLLANNNHSGLLTSKCPIWGSHENYLTERHPTEFGELLLPFLVTRTYGGAGGIEYPSGNFLAAVRPVRMELASGGGTTECRAIHSTAREEHHMGPSPKMFRYHLILGDGHRSHFNLALQFGATALALKAVIYDRQLAREVKRMSNRMKGAAAVTMLKQLNVLARPGKRLTIDPLVIQTQRIYLKAAIRYVDQLADPPQWMPRTLRDWEQTLAAMERLDLDWLSSRLDTFAKYRFYSAALEQEGKTWTEVAGNEVLFHELGLLDHSYHEFCNPRSVFFQLQRAGLVDHRVAPRIEPGDEKEPFVPETNTRAMARGRFLRDHAEDRYVIVDWSWVQDLKQNRIKWICDPCANEFESWTHGDARRQHRLRERLATMTG